MPHSSLKETSNNKRNKKGRNTICFFFLNTNVAVLFFLKGKMLISNKVHKYMAIECEEYITLLILLISKLYLKCLFILSLYWCSFFPLCQEDYWEGPGLRWIWFLIILSCFRFMSSRRGTFSSLCFPSSPHFSSEDP